MKNLLKYEINFVKIVWCGSIFHLLCISLISFFPVVILIVVIYRVNQYEINNDNKLLYLF